MTNLDGTQGFTNFESTSNLLKNKEIVSPLSPDVPEDVKANQKKAQAESIFSKYDSDNNSVVTADEQRIALTNKISGLYHNLKKNMNMSAIGIIKKFSVNFSDIKTDGTAETVKRVDKQLDSALDKYANDIVKLQTEGNDRTSDYESQGDFAKAQDLKPGDYHVSSKGNILQYNGKDKNWSLYTAR